MIPLRICPPFCTFLPRKRYWPPLQSPPTSNIQECWFSSVLFANFYDCPRNNYRNDFPKFRPLISMHIHCTLYFTRENTYSLTTIVFNACLEKQSLKLAPNWMQVQTRSSLVICSIVNWFNSNKCNFYEEQLFDKIDNLIFIVVFVSQFHILFEIFEKFKMYLVSQKLTR